MDSYIDARLTGKRPIDAVLGPIRTVGARREDEPLPSDAPLGVWHAPPLDGPVYDASADDPRDPHVLLDMMARGAAAVERGPPVINTFIKKVRGLLHEPRGEDHTLLCVPWIPFKATDVLRSLLYLPREPCEDLGVPALRSDPVAREAVAALDRMTSAELLVLERKIKAALHPLARAQDARTAREVWKTAIRTEERFVDRSDGYVAATRARVLAELRATADADPAKHYALVQFIGSDVRDLCPALPDARLGTQWSVAQALERWALAQARSSEAEWARRLRRLPLETALRVPKVVAVRGAHCSEPLCTADLVSFCRARMGDGRWPDMHTLDATPLFAQRPCEVCGAPLGLMDLCVEPYLLRMGLLLMWGVSECPASVAVDARPMQEQAFVLALPQLLQDYGGPDGLEERLEGHRVPRMVAVDAKGGWHRVDAARGRVDGPKVGPSLVQDRVAAAVLADPTQGYVLYMTRPRDAADARARLIPSAEAATTRPEAPAAPPQRTKRRRTKRFPPT